MRRLIVTLTPLLLALAACNDTPEWKNSPEGNFDALWTIIDEHYSFFEQKDVDWKAVGAQYRARLTPKMTQQELFDLCGDMLKELHDGHTNLIASHDVSRYWIWEQHPENYDQRLVDDHYLHFNYRQTCGIKYQILDNNIGYIYYGSFDSSIGEGNLDQVFTYLATCDALVIDVRNNGGGFLTNVETLVGRFIDKRTLAGYIQHKTGPAHNAFSAPYAYYFEPTRNHIHYLKPVAVLTNRASFSATNNFVSIMKGLPSVVVVGDTTGGGSGLPFTGEMPNGWRVRFSSCPIKDRNGVDTEPGIAPDLAVALDPELAAQGRDLILDTAVDTLLQMKLAPGAR